MSVKSNNLYAYANEIRRSLFMYLTFDVGTTSMKTGVFMDKYDKNSELSMKTGVFMDGRIEII